MASIVVPPQALPGAPVRTTGTRALSLRSNVLLTLTGWSVYTACQALQLIMLAHLGTPAAVGQFGLAIAITAPVIMFASLQLRVVQATDTDGDYEFADYFVARLAGLLAAMLMIGAIAFTVDYSWETRGIVLLLGVAKCIESISDVYYGSFQKHERVDLFSRSLLIKGLLSVILFAGVYAATHDLAWTVAAVAIGWVLVLYWHDAASCRQCEPRLRASNLVQSAGNWRNLIRLIWLAAPLGLVTGLMSLEVNIPRYFVGRACGEADLGRFTAVSYLLFTGEIIIVSMSYAAVPRLAKLYRAGSVSFWNTLGRLLLVTIALGMAGCAVVDARGQSILRLVFGPSYSEFTDVFLILAIAAALQFCATTLALALRAMRNFQSLLMIRVATTAILLGCCVALVPRYGAMGAAWAMLINAVCHVLAMLAICAVMWGGSNKECSPGGVQFKC